MAGAFKFIAYSLFGVEILLSPRKLQPKHKFLRACCSDVLMASWLQKRIAKFNLLQIVTKKFIACIKSPLKLKWAQIIRPYKCVRSGWVPVNPFSTLPVLCIYIPDPYLFVSGWIRVTKFGSGSGRKFGCFRYFGFLSCMCGMMVTW